MWFEVRNSSSLGKVRAIGYHRCAKVAVVVTLGTDVDRKNGVPDKEQGGEDESG